MLILTQEVKDFLVYYSEDIRVNSLDDIRYVKEVTLQVFLSISQRMI